MEMTCEQLKATVSDLTHQHYLETAASAGSSVGIASKKKKRKQVK